MKANSIESIKRNIARRKRHEAACQEVLGCSMEEYQEYMKQRREAARRERRVRRQVALAKDLAGFYRDIVEICESSPFNTIRPVLTSRGLELANA